MGDDIKDSAIVIWFSGIPFIIMLIKASDKDKDMDLLLINTNKFNSGEEIIRHVRYIEKLMNR